MNDHIKESIDEYVKNGRPLGHFLTAVMENNLMEAFGRADLENQRDMHKILVYIYNETPRACWGSPTAVKEWLDGHRILREG